MDVNAAPAVPGGAGPRAARHRFVVAKLLVPKGDVVAAALTRRARLKRVQHNVHNALRGQHIPTYREFKKSQKH